MGFGKMPQAAANEETVNTTCLTVLWDPDRLKTKICTVHIYAFPLTINLMSINDAVLFLLFETVKIYIY
jgi:hypothetical protein